ncbi:MAG: archaeosortase/exosortase family protein [Candidatus Aenigmarchaeota archaeon]|nr:archaeosortase/exosortase family protein [Candidatus Aenigmarchaeota archaeon]
MKPRHKKQKTRRKRPKNAVFSAGDFLRQQKRAIRKTLVFLVKFNLLSIPLYAIILTGFQSGFLMDATSNMVVAFLRATGMETAMHGNIITVPVKDGSFGAFVSWDSTGWKSMLAMFALVFATEFPLRKKMFGLVLIPLVYAVNILRIWFMFFISTVDTNYFALAHLTVWSWGLIFAVLGLWIIWMKKF